MGDPPSPRTAGNTCVIPHEHTAKEYRLGTYIGHDDDALPRNVIFLECLPKDAFRISVRANVTRGEGADAVIISVCKKGKLKR